NTMKLTVQNIYDFYAPSQCERRLFYRFIGEKEASPGPFEQVIFRLGQRHEKNHIDSLGEYVNVSRLPSNQRPEKTKELIQSNAPIIYQGVLVAEEIINEYKVQIIGVPDILIHEDISYVIRDCKLARHADAKKHPEILIQLQVYGYLYEKNTQSKPARLEAFLGDGSIVEFPYDGGDSAMEVLKALVDIVSSHDIPYSPVGWSKCQGCGFSRICWDVAVERNDVALVYGVDQSLARVLKDEGILTIDDLLTSYDEVSLCQLKKPWGTRVRKVGNSARGILFHARAMKEKMNVLVDKVDLPDNSNLVMFDVEGLPPYLDELEKVYLWGIQVYGEKPGPFIPALSAISPDGDQKSWEDFLSNCCTIFNEYGDIPFVHWHHYEKIKVELYMERYGDSKGVAQRVLDNLVDLLPLTKKAMVLAEPSYSLKVVERCTGFKRSQNEYGAKWSMAKYIEAVETEDGNLRQDIIDQILKYNEEDLAASWAVFQWLKKQVGK
ncbi:TM0106 family RecB-like putative nuclease, partial [Candidatus Aerophobetes bacterium]|nr:TM0106 family RecB-like putative nuclease [Candidatus Aerophobetes bacterium]